MPEEIEGLLPDSIGDKGKSGFLISAHRSGPLPSPVEMKAYAEIIPDFPERAMRLWEREVDSRHAFLSKEVETDNQEVVQHGRAVKRGQWMGFCLAILLVVLTALTALYGSTSAQLLSGIGLIAWVMVQAIAALQHRSAPRQ